MKKLLLALVSVLTALVLPGCFQYEATIHLNKDGSGTLVEETRLGAQMLAMLDQMASFGGGDNAKGDPVAKLFSEDKAKARAAALGEGVEFEKSEPIQGKGARVTYHFKDINTLKLSTEDSMKNLSPMGAARAPAEKKSTPMSFAYADGKLTITMQAPIKAATPDSPAGDHPENPDMAAAIESPEMQDMIKQQLGDMKMSVKVVVEPGIATSNATYQSGNTITLMDMDMGKILEKPGIITQLDSLKKNPAAAIQAFKGVAGAKIEAQKEITVQVK